MKISLASILAVVVVLQWIVLSLVLLHHQSEEVVEVAATTSTAKPPGVAVTVFFRAPRWFHLRYTLLLQNARANLPPDWVLQVFVNQPWFEKEVQPWHPGIERVLKDNNVIVTPLPPHLLQKQTKPKDIFLDRWFWEHMAADRVLLFSGNGAFCAHHDPTIWQQLESLDYCGTPSHHSPGGDGGTHSYRYRPAMLKALDYAKEHNLQPRGGEHTLFVQALRKMGTGRIATPEQSQAFGGVNVNDSLRVPLVLSGTQAQLSWTDRDSVLKHCPELKVIFPSLHEPACFGAHPNGTICKSTLCALQDEIPRQGC